MNRSTLYPGIHGATGGARALARPLPRVAGILILVMTALAALPPGAATAQNWYTRDSQVRSDRDQLHGDRQDARVLANLISHLRQASVSGDRLAEIRYRNQTYAFLRQEIEETRREVMEDQREAHHASDDRWRSRDRQGDWRDRGDDLRDATESRNRLEREEAIYARLRSIQPALWRGSWRAELRERRLLGEFLELVRQDARQSAQELREDGPGPGEYRGDRREDRNGSY